MSKPKIRSENPMTSSTYISKKLDIPIMITPELNVAILAKAMSRFFHKLSGIIGEGAFICLHKNATSPMINKESNVNIGNDVHSQLLPPSIKIIINEEIVIKNKNVPE